MLITNITFGTKTKLNQWNWCAKYFFWLLQLIFDILWLLSIHNNFFGFCCIVLSLQCCYCFYANKMFAYICYVACGMQHLMILHQYVAYSTFVPCSLFLNRKRSSTYSCFHIVNTTPPCYEYKKILMNRRWKFFLWLVTAKIIMLPSLTNVDFCTYIIWWIKKKVTIFIGPCF